MYDQNKSIENETGAYLPHDMYQRRSPDQTGLEERFRYQLPLSVLQSFRWKLRKVIREALHDCTDFFTYFEPESALAEEWEIVLDYLERQGLILRKEHPFESRLNDEPALYMTRLFANRNFFAAHTDGNVEKINSFARGAAKDPYTAVSIVIGEFLERFPFALYRKKDLLYASVEELSRSRTPFLDPSLTDMFDTEQKERFPKRKYSEQSRFAWTKMIRFSDHKKVYVPAQMVYWNYKFQPEEPVLKSPITSGLGGMFTPEGAALSGLLETIQRDGFLLYWLSKMIPDQFDLSTVTDKETQELIALCRCWHLDVYVMETTTDIGVPSCVCVLVDTVADFPKAVMGGGCDFDIQSAIHRSIIEALSIRQWVRINQNFWKQEVFEFDPHSYEPFIYPFQQSGRVRFWADARNFPLLEYFISGKKKSAQEQGRKDIFLGKTDRAKLDALMHSLKKKGPGYEVYKISAKSEVLDALGFSSVRIIVPELLQLYVDETFAPLGSRRLREWFEKHGKDIRKDINPLPHPFP